MSDVCLILEGTFPYVVGGVSTWIYDLIRGLPDVKFSVIHLSPTPTTYRELKYPFPKNLVSFRETYLFDHHEEKKTSMTRRKKQALQEMAVAYRELARGNMGAFKAIAKWIHSGPDCPLNMYDFLHSKPVWDFLVQQYQLEKTQPSFIDYFWTWRLLHLPMIQLLRAPVPEAKVYHAISTGYAGLLAAATQIRTGKPLLLTEHGIYTRERKIEIFQAGWIYSELPQSMAITSTKDFFRDWWIRMFAWMSRLTYHHADAILTLFERNRLLQVEEGADDMKTRVIPNGVLWSRFARIQRPTEPHDPPRLAFVGRVVPIKDVKTFIKAVKELTLRWPKISADIAGPTDEDPAYYQECEQLVRALHLEQTIRFPGRVNVDRIYETADVIVLTSISEAQPLVILEANACGIPVVATDVGACQELLEGHSPLDRALGKSGLVTPIGDPSATARAIQVILEDPGLYRRMSVAAKNRVARFYRQDVVLAQYQTLYEAHIHRGAMQEKTLWPA